MRSAIPEFLILVAGLGASTVEAIQLDPLFHGGVVTIPQPTDATGIALQSDGRIVVLGRATSAGNGIVLVGLTPTGDLDDSFGTGGRVEFYSPGVSLFPSALVVDSTDRLVVAGVESAGTSSSFFAARFLSNGAIDSSFDGGGVAIVDFAGVSSGAGGLALQPDGSILLAGGTSNGTAGDFAAVRLLTDGTLDPSFGAGGRLVLDLGTGFGESAQSVVVRADGRIVLGGQIETGSGYALTLAGLLPDGSSDLGFGIGGRTTLTVAESSSCSGLALQADGKVVAVGQSYNPSGSVVARLLPNGALDGSFGSGGITMFSFMSATGVAVDAAGRILVGGEGLSATFALTRLLGNGHLDPSLGPAGYVHVLGGAPPQPAAAHANAIAIQPDGRILLAGGQSLTAAFFMTVVRFVDAATSVPTLSGAGLAALAIGLAAAGWLAMRRIA